MIDYTIKVSICWLVFYSLYRLLLHRETFFNANRFYLLATLCLSLLIPTLELPDFLLTDNQQSPANYLQPITVGVQSLSYTIDEIVITPMGQTSSLSIGKILLIIYWLGVAFFALRFFAGLGQIFKLYRKGDIEHKQGYKHIHTPSFHLPFSFFNCLFWSNEFKVEDQDHDKILRHELAHIHGWHSLDVVLLEVLKIIFWCSPLIYFYKKSLQNIHEYLADAEVLQTTAKKHYGQLLLRHSQSGLQYALANNFIQSQLKKRIQMMMKHKSKRSALAKYLIALPVLLLMALLFSNQQVIAQISGGEAEETEVLASNALPVNKVATDIGDPIYKEVDQMPRFPGCEDVSDKEERKLCSQKKMLTFIYSNIKYPQAARKAGIQGTTVVRFVVNKQGGIEQAELLRNIGGGCGEEALRVINSMPNFIPGKHQDKAVNVYFNIPIKYKLDDGAKPHPKDILNKMDQSDKTPLYVIDDVMYEEKPKDLNPDDILTINVMKGNAAVLTYGEKVRDGVIIINTKKGKKMSEKEMEKEAYRKLMMTARFPGCEEIKDEYERVNCSKKKLLSFVYENVQYPKAAAKAGIEGIVLVKFLITKEGKITEKQIVRSLSEDCDKEVLRVVDQMAGLPERWAPAVNEEGKTVKSYFNLPIKFKLPKEEAAKRDDFPKIDNTLQLEQVKVFPNPATAELNLSFLSPGGNMEIQLTDINGKLLYAQKVDDLKGQFNQRIDLSDMPKGTLLLSIIQGEKIHSEKVIVQ